MLHVYRHKLLRHLHIHIHIHTGPKDTWPPIMTVVPEFSFTLPEGITCGRVSDGQLSGTFTTPGFPSYSHNLDCAFVINVPKGYYVQIELNRFSIETR